MTSSVTWLERFEYFSSFLKYIFRYESASFWVIIMPKQKQTKPEPEV